MRKIRNYPLVPVLWWPDRFTKFPNTAIMVPLPSVGQAMFHGEQHGIRFADGPDKLKRSMDDCNIAYLHAQLSIRQFEVCRPCAQAIWEVITLFNLLGPLVQSLQAYLPVPRCGPILHRCNSTRNVFFKLSIDFAVVNSLDSYDEISP